LESPRREPKEPEDVALLAQIAQGDIDCFQLFYLRFGGRVLAYARQLCRDRELAEDVTQEVFAAVWAKAASFRPERGDAAGWLYGMTRNRLIDHWRKVSARAEVGTVDDRHPGGHGAGGVEVQLSVQQALSAVAPEQRRAIEMAYFGGLTYEETAARLELPLGTLKSRIRSGLRTMRTLLDG
jgi:RNA polymerase sigma-70 factor (ECF subfamily)